MKRCSSRGCRRDAVSHGYCLQHEQTVSYVKTCKAWAMMKQGLSLSAAAWVLGVRSNDLNVALNRHQGEHKWDREVQAPQPMF